MTDFAAAFTRMAERIAAIEEADFNGAFVVVTPDGTVIDQMLQGSRDEGSFWILVKTKTEVGYAEFQQRGMEQTFGGFRR